MEFLFLDQVSTALATPSPPTDCALTLLFTRARSFLWAVGLPHRCRVRLLGACESYIFCTYCKAEVVNEEGRHRRGSLVLKGIEGLDEEKKVLGFRELGLGF